MKKYNILLILFLLIIPISNAVLVNETLFTATDTNTRFYFNQSVYVENVTVSNESIEIINLQLNYSILRNSKSFTGASFDYINLSLSDGAYYVFGEEPPPIITGTTSIVVKMLGIIIALIVIAALGCALVTGNFSVAFLLVVMIATMIAIITIRFIQDFI
jgi:hypothetical protein